MESQYCGFRVKLTCSQLGDVVGTVCNVTENVIELSHAILNGCGSPVPFVAVQSQFIQNLRILATGTGDSSECTTPNKVPEKSSGSSSRAERREKLRNIPNAFSAYVCPDSPPVIHRSHGISECIGTSGNSSAQKDISVVQHLNTALADVALHDTSTASKSSKRHRNGRFVKLRSYSVSETAASSEVSGAESDSFYRAQKSTSQATCPNSHRPYGLSRSLPRSTIPANRSSGTNRHSAKADWDKVRVEDFIDQDFDFEKNLALFDKNAFYEMVDMRQSATSKSSTSQHLLSPKPLDQGSDSSGTPLMNANSDRAVKSNKDYYDDCTMTTNTATLSSAKQRHEHCVPYYHPSSQAPTDVTNISLRSGSHTVCTVQACSNPAITGRFWHTATGLRVPTLPVDDHSRMLHYLATGVRDLSNTPLDHSSSTPTAQGLSWGRILETAGRALLDYVVGQLRQPSNTPQRSTQRPPPRILVIPGHGNLSGAFALTMARLLAIRGACVLIFAPRALFLHSESLEQSFSSMPTICQTELHLCTHLAPRPNLYGGLEDPDPFNTSIDSDDEQEEEEEDRNVILSNETNDINDSVSNPLSVSDGDNSEIASCLTLDQLTAQPMVDAMDSSPLHRMWISRIPGLKVLRRATSITKLPSNVRIDLVILGYAPGNEPTDAQLSGWLQGHSSLSRVAYLMPHCATTIDQYALRNAPIQWVIEWGLPKILPPTRSESLFNAPSTSHLLIDVGMSRNAILRLTSDLKFLPPYGLFESGSVVGLRPGTGSAMCI